MKKEDLKLKKKHIKSESAVKKLEEKHEKIQRNPELSGRYSAKQKRAMHMNVKKQDAEKTRNQNRGLRSIGLK